MNTFINEDFLLQSRAARDLYHGYAAAEPIIDYHCHLSPRDIALDRQYRNMSELWLSEDHYKWRAMRINGVPENLITGQGAEEDKFMAWAQTVASAVGNPLYHWTHLELKRFFDNKHLITPQTAPDVWESCNARLSEPGFTVRGLIRRANVEVICTTDDPADTLEYHQAIADDTTFQTRVLPTFRADRCLQIGNPAWPEWLKKLAIAENQPIDSLDSFKTVLTRRVAHFKAAGCRVSDLSLEAVCFMTTDDQQAAGIFQRWLNGGQLTDEDVCRFKSNMLVFLGRLFAGQDWVMQLHIGALRNNNARMFRLLGPDSGFDAIGDFTFIEDLSRFLSALEDTGELPKTILYCLNPRDNEILGALAGCFQGGGVAGKIQVGPGWWFNDQKDGMIRQMTSLASLSLLSRFIGMTTDSRSFLSFTRHEYFRRILCNLVGGWIENGEAPDDLSAMGAMISDICSGNARRYFGF